MDLPELTGKQLQYLRETVPRLSRIGVIWDERVGKAPYAEAETVARARNISLHPVPLHSSGEADDVMKRLLVASPSDPLDHGAGCVRVAISVGGVGAPEPATIHLSFLDVSRFRGLTGVWSGLSDHVAADRELC
jgi:hypothetical protein